MNSKFFNPLFVSVACFVFISAARAEQPLQIFDGDRIVLLGDTLIEREQEFGFLETRLYMRFPDRKFIVRNLGWSGDGPAGESRARFDFAQPGKGQPGSSVGRQKNPAYQPAATST